MISKFSAAFSVFSATKATGLTLIELLISVVLASAIMAAVFKVFFFNQQLSVLHRSYATVQDSARVALEVLTRDIRMAGNFGCSTGGGVLDMRDLNDEDYQLEFMDFLGADIEGLDDVSAVTIGGQSVSNGSDVLILRGGDSVCHGKGKVLDSGGGSDLVLSSACHLSVGQPALIANCEGAELFTVTGLVALTNPDSTSVLHGANAGEGFVDNQLTAFSRSYNAGSTILQPFKRFYYLADGIAGTSLFVNDAGVATELVAGITNFQVLYGEDSDGDGSVNTYRQADDVALNWANVKSVRLSVVVSNDRHSETFESLINIRNKSL